MALNPTGFLSTLQNLAFHLQRGFDQYLRPWYAPQSQQLHVASGVSPLLRHLMIFSGLVLCLLALLHLAAPVS